MHGLKNQNGKRTENGFSYQFLPVEPLVFLVFIRPIPGLDFETMISCLRFLILI